MFYFEGDSRISGCLSSRPADDKPGHKAAEGSVICHMKTGVSSENTVR